MRWSIIRLIWLRELRDQLRDRRTLFMIVGLPLVLYPALGVVVLTFALQFFEKPSLIGIVREPNSPSIFPPRGPLEGGISPVSWVSYIAQTANLAMGTDPWAGPLSRGVATQSHFDYPPLVNGNRWCGPAAAISRRDASIIASKFKIIWLDPDDKTSLRDRTVDLVLRPSPGFYEALQTEELGVVLSSKTTDALDPEDSPALTRPTVRVQLRPDDDHSRQALNRLRAAIDRWKSELKKVRFVRRGIDAAFDEPFVLEEPRTKDEGDAEKLVDMVIRIFPFMLVMWSLAGALYPAVDLCAGEKERGTMETLLITPAGREEIVLGKFLTIWVFSTASALLNLFSMGLTTWQFSAMLPHGAFPIGAIFWCIILSLPLTALFSAISLAIGAYARSSKEGQYYLMPMFLVTMPLIFLTLAPGVELNPVYSLIPVTGVALLMQKLMTAPSLAQVPWLYFIPVLAPIALYSALALRWAIDQFQREEVLFREAERLDIGLWFRHLFRDKETTTTAGQAFFCFALLLGLKWLSLSVGTNLSPLVHTGVSLLAFVATPALMMALMLNTRPIATLQLRWPRWSELGLAFVFAALLMPPLLWGSRQILVNFPQLKNLLDNPRVFTNQFTLLSHDATGLFGNLLVLALLPALCEELAFRGVILTGLQKRYRPRTAIFLCAFMNALFHMNVFAFLPIFGVCVVLGLLTVRSGSIVPAMVLHGLSKAALVLALPLASGFDTFLPENMPLAWPVIACVCFATAFAIFWWLYRKPYVE